RLPPFLCRISASNHLLERIRPAGRRARAETGDCLISRPRLGWTSARFAGRRCALAARGCRRPPPPSCPPAAPPPPPPRSAFGRQAVRAANCLWPRASLTRLQAPPAPPVPRRFLLC